MDIPQEHRRMPWLVSIDWLKDHLNSPDVVVVDASWHMPDSGRNAEREYLSGHIPHAVFFDIDAIADRSSALPHMLPTPLEFSEAVGRLGISQDKVIVVYDRVGLFTAPRVWWTFMTFGAEKVYVLDGGFPAWEKAELQVDQGRVNKTAVEYQSRFRVDLVVNAEAVLKALNSDRWQIIDARSAARFNGEIPEPRSGLRAGHIPGSLNVPFNTLIEDGLLKSAEDIRKIFEEAGVDLKKPAITTCGSGVTAAVLTFALHNIGSTHGALYDGSWVEWGGRNDLPLG